MTLSNCFHGNQLIFLKTVTDSKFTYFFNYCTKIQQNQKIQSKNIEVYFHNFHENCSKVPVFLAGMFSYKLISKSVDISDE